MKLMIVQYGNYAEAFRRFEVGGPETYRDQRASVDFVASLTPANTVTTVAVCDDEHELELREGLHSIGMSERQFDRAGIARLFDRLAPDLVVCATPHLGILRLARTRRIPTLPCFADILSTKGPRSALHNFRLRRVLSGSNFPCIANHSLNASRSVASCLRYPRERIVPWDWSRVATAYPAKAGVAEGAVPSAFFAGMLSEEKGVGDCLGAIGELRDRGLRFSMAFAGPGDLGVWRARAEELGVAEAVSFLGVIPNQEVRERMRAHDLVIVPSRHGYAEGLPNTIYEGLASRSPLILSDHPAFQGRLTPDSECLVFRAADPRSLADGMARLLADRELYATLSENAPTALQRLYVGIEWRELMTLFLGDPTNASGWVGRHSLKALNL